MGARAVALVACSDLGEHGLEGYHVATLGKLGMTAPGPDLGTRRYEDLGFRIRAYDGPDIAPVEHRAGPASGEIALEAEQRRPDAEIGGDDRGRARDLLAAQVLLTHEVGLERLRRGERHRCIARIMALRQHGEPHHAVERA